ncbi:MAG: GTPase ObgE, partial [Bacteroidales bacterium]|nr:GTPase ObgE [Bacteroidales bacterium]
MSNVNFVDYVKVFCRSGNGGAGSAHLRRDKLTAMGG